jgi:hypothetical protein
MQKANIHNHKNKSPDDKKKNGFIQIILIIILGLIFLRVAGIDVITILNKPAVKEFAIYVKDMLAQVIVDLKQIFNFFLKA